MAAREKSDRGRVTADQQAWLDDLHAAGVETFVWRPDDWHTGTVERALR